MQNFDYSIYELIGLIHTYLLKSIFSFYYHENLEYTNLIFQLLWVCIKTINNVELEI